MLEAGPTCEGVNTNLLNMGTMGSFFSWHVEDSLLLSVSYLQTGASKYWFFVPKSGLPLIMRVLEEHMDPDGLQAAGGDLWTVQRRRPFCGQLHFSLITESEFVPTRWRSGTTS